MTDQELSALEKSLAGSRYSIGQKVVLALIHRLKIAEEPAQRYADLYPDADCVLVWRKIKKSKHRKRGNECKSRE